MWPSGFYIHQIGVGDVLHMGGQNLKDRGSTEGVGKWLKDDSKVTNVSI
jgi:hypothetical protein